MRESFRLSQRSRVLAVVAAVTVSLVILGRAFHTPEGFSTSPSLTELVLPMVGLLFLTAGAVMLRLIVGAESLDIVWLQWRRSEVAGIILLMIVMPTGYYLTAVLMRKWGLSLEWGTFWASQRSLAFFMALTFRIAILGPILEEVFWRGHVQAALEPIAGRLPALVTQAILFAAVHLRPWGGFIPVLVFGLVTGLWRWRRRTLVPIIMAHIACNGLWCAVHWPVWLDFTRIRPTTNYVTQMADLAKPANYDPSDDARDDYEKARQLAVRIPVELEQVRGLSPARWSPEARQGFVRWVEANGQALDYVERGSKKPYFWPVFAGTPMRAAMPPLGSLRDLVFALDARIKLGASGQEKVLVDVATLYRLGRHLGGPKVLVHQLCGIDIRNRALGAVRSIVANPSISPQTLQALQKQLEEFMATDDGIMDFGLERLVWLDCIQRLFTDDGNGEGHIAKGSFDLEKLPESIKSLIGTVPPGQKEAFSKLTRSDTVACVERFFSQIRVAASMTPWAFQKGPSRVQDGLEILLRENAFVDLLGRPGMHAMELPWRTRTDLEATVAAIAVLRYTAARGDLPESLEELVQAGYLDRVPPDSYSNGPLIYKRGLIGFLLYSRGADFIDDDCRPSKWGEGAGGGDQVFWPFQEPVAQ